MRGASTVRWSSKFNLLIENLRKVLSIHSKTLATSHCCALYPMPMTTGRRPSSTIRFLCAVWNVDYEVHRFDVTSSHSNLSFLCLLPGWRRCHDSGFCLLIIDLPLSPFLVLLTSLRNSRHFKLNRPECWQHSLAHPTYGSVRLFKQWIMGMPLPIWPNLGPANSSDLSVSTSV